jgi:hypothetical protein
VFEYLYSPGKYGVWSIVMENYSGYEELSWNNKRYKELLGDSNKYVL